MSKFDNQTQKKQEAPKSKFCSHPGCQNLGTITFSARAEGPWLCREHFAKRKHADNVRRTSEGAKQGISKLRDKLKMALSDYTNVQF